jgi:transcriptional regulator with XRE-family HTH domain
MKQFRFEKIREFRIAAGMTQIGEWENKREGGLNVTALSKLAEALGKSTDDFFVDNDS